MDKLFIGSPLVKYLNTQKDRLGKIVYSYCRDEFVRDEERFIESTVSKFRTIPPKLKMDEKYMLQPEEIIKSGVMCLRLVVIIPIEGHSFILDYKPSTTYAAYPHGKVVKDEIVMEFIFRSENEEAINSKVERNTKLISDYIGFAQKDIDKYNLEIVDIARKVYNVKKRFIQENDKKIGLLNIPIK